ncbi:hypothetical protein, partial [Archangium violaceum]
MTPHFHSLVPDGVFVPRGAACALAAADPGGTGAGGGPALSSSAGA